MGRFIRNLQRENNQNGGIYGRDKEIISGNGSSD